MEDNWKDSGKQMGLVCTAKEVYLDEVMALQGAPNTCEAGSYITISLKASVHFNAARYDPGWYVALDGNDAYTGNCTINGLRQEKSYKVTAGHKSNEIVGSVSWSQDHFGGNDKCGDIMMSGGGGCNIEVPFAENTYIKCVDNDGDGHLDFGTCFSWRVAGNDDFCTLSKDDPSTKNNFADLYPATPSKCFCTRYNVPNIQVVQKPNHKPAIEVRNSVYNCDDNGVSCASNKAADTVSGPKNSNVTHCFEVKNTGNTYLGSVQISNNKLSFTKTLTTPLGPGESKIVSVVGTIAANADNIVTVSANPVDKSGVDLNGLNDVSASDTASVVVANQRRVLKGKPIPASDPIPSDPYYFM